MQSKELKLWVIMLSCIFTMITSVKSLAEISPAHDWFSQKDFQFILDKETHTKSYADNKIKLLINGVNSIRQRTENIEEADVILIKTFEFRDDETGNALVNQLLRKAKSGAKIFIQFDVKGTRDTPQEQKQIWLGKENPIPPLLQQLTDAEKNNIFIIPTSVPTHFFDYAQALLGIYIPNNHEKYLITWNTKNLKAPVKVIMGGLNIGDNYMFGGVKDAGGEFKITPCCKNYGFRDTDAEVIGPVNQVIVKRYLKAAEEQSQNQNDYFKKHIYQRVVNAIDQLKIINHEMDERKNTAFPVQLNGENARFISKSMGQRNVEHALIVMLSYFPANETFKLITPFFLPTQTLQDAMLSAAKRGVKFKILTNGTDAVESGFVTVAKAAHCRYRYLNRHAEKDTLQFYEWHGSKTMGVSSVHEKVFSIGSSEMSPFIIGSSNVDPQSLVRNSEGILLIQNAALKQQFDNMLNNDFNQPSVHKLTKDELENEPLLEKFYECGYDWVFHSVL